MKKTPEDIEITFRIYFEITLSEEECRLLRRLDPEKEFEINLILLIAFGVKVIISKLVKRE